MKAMTLHFTIDELIDLQKKVIASASPQAPDVYKEFQKDILTVLESIEYKINEEED